MIYPISTWQEVLVFLNKVMNELGQGYTLDQLKEFVWKTLKSGQVCISNYHIRQLLIALYFNNLFPAAELIIIYNKVFYANTQLGCAIFNLIMFHFILATFNMKRERFIFLVSSLIVSLIFCWLPASSFCINVCWQK